VVVVVDRDAMESETSKVVDPDGTPDSVPTKTPDKDLRLTDDGLEMPDFLKGYVGEFTIRTPNVTGDLETSDAGMPEGDFSDGVIDVYPEGGDYHGDLEEGMLAISTDEHGETVYEVVDERTEEND